MVDMGKKEDLTSFSIRYSCVTQHSLVMVQMALMTSNCSYKSSTSHKQVIIGVIFNSNLNTKCVFILTALHLPHPSHYFPAQ